MLQGWLTLPLFASEVAIHPEQGVAGLLIALVTLTAMEIVLGIDNIIFIAIVAGRLPKDQQARARTVGLMVALGTRLLLLAAIGWIMTLKYPLFSLPEGLGLAAEIREVTGKDLILLIGGMFLIGKSVYEIHHKLEGDEESAEQGSSSAKGTSFAMVITQIALLDVIFSLDSILTGVGMIRDISQIWIIVVAIIVSVGVMVLAAGPISDFISKHPTLKILALAFLILIGVLLVAEGTGQHFDKGYIYFAMAFAFAIELLNMRMRAHQKAVQLHEPHMPKG